MLSVIIPGTLTPLTSSQPPSIQKRIKLSDFVGGSKNAISEALITHQIRNASTRVFADPLRAFFELVVNALDASNPLDVSIGMFGMGFLSNLAFLEFAETKGCSLVLQTTYKKEGKLFSYRQTITQERGVPCVEHTALAAESETGTTIAILPNVGTFSNESLKGIEKYCYDLAFYPHGHVDLNGKKIGKGKNTQAWVEISESKLCVRDKGCGISEEISRTRLYIPGSSTKLAPSLDYKEDRMALPQFTEWAFSNEQERFALFLVGGVIAYKVAFKESSLKQDILIRLPQSTPIPLARNCVDFNLATRTFLGKLTQNTIEEILAKKENPELLLALYRAFCSLKDQRLAKALLEEVQKQLNKSGLMVLPWEFQKELTSLVKGLKNALFLPSALVSENFALFEKHIAESIPTHTNLIFGKKVIFVRDLKKVVTYGFKTLIFAPLFIFENAKKAKYLKVPLTQRVAFSIAMRYWEEGKRISIDGTNKAMQSSKIGRNFLLVEQSNSIEPHIRPLGEFLEGLLPKQNFQFYEELYKKHEQIIIAYLAIGSMEFDSCDDLLNAIFPFANDFLICKDHASAEAIFATIKNKNINDDCKNQWLAKNWLIRIGKAEVAKIALEQVIYFLQIIKIAFGNELITPLSQLSFEEIEGLFLTLIAKHREGVYDHHIDHVLPLFFVPSLDFLSKADIEELHIFTDYEKHFKQAFIPNLLPLINLRHTVLNRVELDESIKEKIVQFVFRSMAGYEKFFQVPFDIIPPVDKLNLSHFDHLLNMKFFNPNHVFFDTFYAETPLFNYKVFDTVVDLLCRFKVSTALKFISLIDEWLSTKLNPTIRDEFFTNKVRPRIPNLEKFNLLAVIVFLYRKQFLTEVEIEMLIENANGHDELYLLLSILVPMTVPKSLIRSLVPDALRALLAGFIRKLDPEVVKKSCTYAPLIWKEEILPENHDIIAAIQGYFNQLILNAIESESNFLNPQYAQKFENAPLFTTNQLLNALSTIDFSQINTLEKFHQAVAPIPTKHSSTLVKTSIEYASDRDPLQACLFELVQNSGDAIISLHRRWPQKVKKNSSHIVFGIDIFRPQNFPGQLLLSIRDFAGMQDLQTLVLHVPHLSRKQGEPDLVGEMGNGSFQIYKDVEMVTRQTRVLSDNKVYLQKIVVLRDQEGKAYDLQHKCIEIQDDDFVGTEIRILFKNAGKKLEDIESEALTLQGLIRNAVSQTRPAMAINIFLKKELLRGIDAKGVSFQISNDKKLSFVFQQLENRGQKGYVLTGGYPFKPLPEFLVEEGLMTKELALQCTNGWCLNLPLGSYTPVQSRSKIGLTKHVRLELQKFIAAWFYFYGRKVTMIPHFENKGGFEQVNLTLVKPDPFDLPLSHDTRYLNNFLLHYKFAKKSFQAYLQDGYENVVKKLVRLKLKILQEIKKNNPVISYIHWKKQFEIMVGDIFKAWQQKLKIDLGNPSFQVHYNHFLNSMLFPWFAVKVKFFIETFPTIEELKETKPNLKTLQEIQNESLMKIQTETLIKDYKEIIGPLCKHILGLYVYILNLKVPLKNQAPKIQFVFDPVNKFAARYRIDLHAIVINITSCHLSAILRLGHHLARGEAIEENIDLSFVTIVPGFSGILNHEFEHARREALEGEDYHGAAFSAFNNFKSFEGCAIEIAVEGRREGLFDLWAQSVNELLVKLNVKAETLEACIKAVEIAEKQSLPLLMDLLT